MIHLQGPGVPPCVSHQVTLCECGWSLVSCCEMINNMLDCEETHATRIELVGFETTSAFWPVQIMLGAGFEIETTQNTNKVVTRSNSNAMATIEMCDRRSAEVHSINFRNGGHSDNHGFHKLISTILVEGGIGTLACTGTSSCADSRM